MKFFSGPELSRLAELAESTSSSDRSLLANMLKKYASGKLNPFTLMFILSLILIGLGFLEIRYFPGGIAYYWLFGIADVLILVNFIFWIVKSFRDFYD